jgi:hypothetical protein
MKKQILTERGSTEQNPISKIETTEPTEKKNSEALNIADKQDDVRRLRA